MSNRSLYGETPHCSSVNIFYRDPAVILHLLVTDPRTNPERVLSTVCAIANAAIPRIPPMPTPENKKEFVRDFLTQNNPSVYQLARDEFWKNLQKDAEQGILPITNITDLKNYGEELFNEFVSKRAEEHADENYMPTLQDTPDIFLRQSLWYYVFVSSTRTCLENKQTLGDLVAILNDIDSDYVEDITTGFNELSISPDTPLVVQDLEAISIKHILTPNIPPLQQQAIKFVEFAARLMKIACLDETMILDIENIGDTLVDAATKSKMGSRGPPEWIILPQDFPRIKEWTPNWIICANNMVKTCVVAYDLAVVEAATGRVVLTPPQELFAQGGVWLIPGEGHIVAAPDGPESITPALITDTYKALGFVRDTEAIPVFISYMQEGFPEPNYPPAHIITIPGYIVNPANPRLFGSRFKVFIDDDSVIAAGDSGDFEEAYFLEDVKAPFFVYLVPRQVNESPECYPLSQTPVNHLDLGVTYPHRIKDINTDTDYEFLQSLRDLVRSPEIILCVPMMDN